MRITYGYYDEKKGKWRRLASPETCLRRASPEFRRMVAAARKGRRRPIWHPHLLRKWFHAAHEMTAWVDLSPLEPRAAEGSYGQTHPWHNAKEAINFENEAQARDWFADHLEFFEKGLRLHENGVEYRCGRMRIDILAVDKDGGFVVIETKMRGSDVAVAQLLRYMGWVRKHLATEGQSVRGIVLVGEVSEALSLAVKEIPNVQLVEYMHSLGVRWH